MGNGRVCLIFTLLFKLSVTSNFERVSSSNLEENIIVFKIFRYLTFFIFVS